MEKKIAELSTQEFEEMMIRTVDKRLQVWLAQLMDALLDSEESALELKDEFATALQHSLEQAQEGQGIDLETFRKQLDNG